MIVDNPTVALSNIENSLFSQVFAGQLADLLSYLRSYEAEVTGRITWNQKSISPSIFLIGKLNAEALSDRLQDVGDNVLETIGQGKSAEAIAIAIVNVVTTHAYPESQNAPSLRDRLAGKIFDCSAIIEAVHLTEATPWRRPLKEFIREFAANLCSLKADAK